MQIQIDDLKIEDKDLTGLVVDHNGDIIFQGRALDEDGERICKGLSKLKIGSTVEITTEFDYHKKQGVYEVLKVSIPPREEKDRIIYRFSGRLKPVY